MVKIFVNYRFKKGKVEIANYGCVFVEQPIAIAELDREYDDPIIVESNNFKYIVERAEYEQEYSKAKANLTKFKLVVDNNGTVRNAKESEQPTLVIDLPKDTDLSKLHYEGGKLIMFDERDMEEINYE